MVLLDKTFQERGVGKQVLALALGRLQANTGDLECATHGIALQDHVTKLEDSVRASMLLDEAQCDAADVSWSDVFKPYSELLQTMRGVRDAQLQMPAGPHLRMQRL